MSRGGLSGSPIEVREVRSDDRQGWGPLWSGYLTFYDHELPAEVTEHLWAGLIDSKVQPHALVAESGGALVGLVHFHFHLSTWRIAGDCYLEDLFVHPGQRGHGVGRMLIEAVYRAAAARGVARVYWQTHEGNAQARALYDNLANRTPFVIYRHDD